MPKGVSDYFFRPMARRLAGQCVMMHFHGLGGGKLHG